MIRSDPFEIRGTISKEGDKTRCILRQSREFLSVDLDVLKGDRKFPEHISFGRSGDLTPTSLTIVCREVTVLDKHDTAVIAASAPPNLSN